MQCIKYTNTMHNMQALALFFYFSFPSARCRQNPARSRLSVPFRKRPLNYGDGFQRDVQKPRTEVLLAPRSAAIAVLEALPSCLSLRRRTLPQLVQRLSLAELCANDHTRRQ